MQPEEEKNETEESSSGLLMAVMGASVCCMCLVVCFFIAYLVWAVDTIFKAVPASSTPCAEDSNIWLFCLVAVIVLPIVGCLINLISKCASDNFLLQLVPSVINLFIAVWGMLLWANMTEECTSFYDNDWSSLLLLFRINVVFLSISFFILVCVVLVGAAALAGILATASGGQTARYENIPDSLDSQTQQQTSGLAEEYV